MSIHFLSATWSFDDLTNLPSGVSGT
ncbi:metal-dependent hydrolase, partial [Salmonella enterica]|nr:metal-dependent hydrolase [Salmonella enterica]EBR4546575.1 metal-dependent hydrolase [Salmonella enterica]